MMTPASNASRRLAMVWLRRDLRLHDHAALHHALRSGARVALLFVFDTDILHPLLRAGAHADRRVAFIHAALSDIDARLRALGGALHVLHGDAAECVPGLAARLGAEAVYVNRDYEPRALRRDAEVDARLAALRIALHAYDDHVVVAPQLLRGGRAYAVYTPYRKAWLAHVHANPALLRPWDCSALAVRLAAGSEGPQPPSLAELGFDAQALPPAELGCGSGGARALLDAFVPRLAGYAQARDFPGRRGTSYLSVHLRFGTISVRDAVNVAWARRGDAGADAWLGELVWREFYAQILFHHPGVVERAFKPAYDAIVWDDAPALLEAWREGRTGYPLVDAGMRQLTATGYMHNRLRMVTASFLCKDLGVDWRLGEAHFALQLNDFDLASNNGGWQWAASSGCDAQPWFRIFNPVKQSRRFDPDGRFIRRYVPELAALPDAALHAPWLADPAVLQRAGVRLGADYPAPVVDHARARARTLQRYAVVRDAAAEQPEGLSDGPLRACSD